tara:strand:+ start:161 stop:604 length:444 start_codon:yes stop_codon:yes gene_type:complete
MASNTALAPNATTSHGGEFKITFYSTSPKDESKSKYPMQTKTSYTVPDNGAGETEIKFGKSISASSRPKTHVIGFRPESQKRDDSKRESNRRSAPEAGSPPGSSTSSEIVRSRSGRISKKPQRYEPVETVTDDFDDIDYDTDDSSQN